ncbi:hypothetical protein ACE6H2_004709 [Prunus campanulata]
MNCLRFYCACCRLVLLNVFYAGWNFWGNVQITGETLPKFRQKVSGPFSFLNKGGSIFSKWARHRCDVRISTGFVSSFEEFGAGPVTYC